MYYLGSEPLSDLFMSALYVEFFDSVNYLIQVKGRLIHYHKSTLIEQKFDSYVYHKKLTMRCGFNTRLEAVSHAISRANIVYNETNPSKK